MMKLLVQGDDFGFTKGVTLGIIDAIEHGILRNTGLFTNMPSAIEAAAYIRNNDRACFGIDFNIVSGPSVSDPSTIPHLVDENGQFIRSGARLKDPRFASVEGRLEMFPYDEVYGEIKVQYDRFILLTGKQPGYLHGHSLNHENYEKAIRDLSKQTGVPYSKDIQKRYGFRSMMDVVQLMPNDPSKTKKSFDPTAQLSKDTEAIVMEHAQYLLGGEYAIIGGHPGFVDNELMGLTTLSLERIKDHAMCVSQTMKQWVKDNHIELITYDDLMEK